MSKLFLVVVALFVLVGIANAEVNINTATQSELETLQGIGPAKAKAIVVYRENNGLFESKGDLEKVSGIGSGTIKKIHGDITVSENVVGKKKVVAKQEK
jgi:competence protein ComEA